MPAPTVVSILRHRLPGSALASTDPPSWPFETHVLVRTLEELDRLSRITLAAAGVKRSKLPKPLIVPRPGEKPPPEPPSKGWLAALVDAKDDSGSVSVTEVA